MPENPYDPPATGAEAPCIIQRRAIGVPLCLVLLGCLAFADATVGLAGNVYIVDVSPTFKALGAIRIVGAILLGSVRKL